MIKELAFEDPSVKEERPGMPFEDVEEMLAQISVFEIMIEEKKQELASLEGRNDEEAVRRKEELELDIQGLKFDIEIRKSAEEY